MQGTIIRLIAAVFVLLFSFEGSAQGRPGRGSSTGRFYGKIISSADKKGVEFAVLRMYQSVRDSSGKMGEKMVGGGITEGNGDFNIDQVPLGADLSLLITAMGYDTLRVQVDYDRQAQGSYSKDIGNISVKPSAVQLRTLEIVEEVDGLRMDIDKRVYNVDKNPVNAGGTAEDVLRNVPSVQVDLDGNVALRGSSPTIFVDGRPTTLTIDQIPADAIQSIEVITNPSAKFDASGGMGGIINIVMKKNRSMGYNGSIRAGVDSRGRFNTGLDINLNEGKFNLFASGNYNQRRRRGDGVTDRLYIGEDPMIQYMQYSDNDNLGYFASGRGGFDWMMDNRNTLTISQSINKGNFRPIDFLETYTDTLGTIEDVVDYTSRDSRTSRNFENLGSQIMFRHVFSREGAELTSDLNFNRIESIFRGDYLSYINNAEVIQLQEGDGGQRVLTFQTDAKTPLNKGAKLEGGIRANVRRYWSDYQNYTYDPDLQSFIEIEELLVDYTFLDQVYAAYGQFSKSYKNWGWQAGLRAESSDYTGELLSTDSVFHVRYPISLFPSAFVNYKLSDKQDIQVNYSRRINRPSFFRLIPFMDYSDSLNLSRGNPGLLPEFTNSFELSYQNLFSRKNSVLITAYYKYTTDLMTRNQITEYSSYLNRDVVISTWQNANSSEAYGLEFIFKNGLTKWMDAVTNVNLYYSSIDGTNIDESLTNARSSWFAKLNLSIRLPRKLSLQLTGDYNSRRALDVSGGEGRGGGGGGGGGGMFGGSVNTVVGYNESNYGVDAALRFEFYKDAMSLSVGISDIFKTRRSITYQESDFFIQTSENRRDWQVLRVNYSWKFGKMDTSVFRRRGGGGGGDMEMM